MNKALAVGALWAGLSVALGAFGAHALPPRLEALGYSGEDLAKRMSNFDTAARYQMYSALGMVLAALAADRRRRGVALRLAPWMLLAGSTVFSGLLIALTFVGPNFRWLGAIVPIGGLGMIAGWLTLAIGAMGRVANEPPQGRPQPS